MNNSEKFKVNYTDTTYFKGLTIYYEYLNEGVEYAIENNISDIFIRSLDFKEKKVVNFDFLKDLSFVKTFHWLVGLSKKSNIAGLYNLKSLEDLRWGPDNEFEIDFAKLTNIKKLSIHYIPELKNLNKLKLLTNLFLQSAKSEDCEFLTGLDSLEKLCVIRGKFRTLKGLEKCLNLKTIFLQSCSNLVEVYQTLKEHKSLEAAVFEGCKKIDIKDGRRDLPEKLRLNVQFKSM